MIKTIRVGPFKYKIEVRNLNEFGDGDTMGYCSPRKQTISVDPDQESDMMRETLLHESLHACWLAAGIPKENEEETISSLSPWLLSLLRDNPKFVEFLLDGL